MSPTKAVLTVVGAVFLGALGTGGRSAAVPQTAPPASPARASAGVAPARPKLVLLIVVDQMRYDYLTRFRDRFKGGLARLLGEGAVFTNAHLEHYPSVTAVGHATMLSGAIPALSGIVGNDWYDRETGCRSRTAARSCPSAGWRTAPTGTTPRPGGS